MGKRKIELCLSKAVRSTTLGLMILLAAVSNCFSESYDPDPWDNTPPVTVEFDYVIPHVVTLRQADGHAAAGQTLAASNPVDLQQLQWTYVCGSSSTASVALPLLVRPLRR